MSEANKINEKPKICLTIAGLDPSGGAGVVADVKTFTAFGCFAAAAITSLTFQNTQGVFGAVNQSAEAVRGQVVPVVEDLGIDGLKTGMLPTAEIIEEIARLASEFDFKNFVVDPVVRSTSGFDLIDDAALRVLIERLFPLADLITPNIPEAERIARIKISSERDIENAAETMRSQGAKNILIKGGHFSVSGGGEKGRKAVDYLFGGDSVEVFEADFIETDATHGTGCTLAAAIAANLANGKNLKDSIRAAKNFVTEAIRTAPDIGKGHSPVNHSIRNF